MSAHTDDSIRPLRGIEAIHDSWPLIVEGTVLTVRRSGAHDLPAAALMHTRCSARSRLDRYRQGGRSPSVITLDRQLRQPLGYAVTSEDGRLVALAGLSPDAAHDATSVEAAILVEDSWQRLGIGRLLLRHLAAVAALSGYRQLVTYPGTATAVVQHLMVAIGSTRMSMVADDRHLHTNVGAAAAYGLGATRAAIASRQPGAIEISGGRRSVLVT